MNFNYKLEPGTARENKLKYLDYKKVISIITPSWNPTKYIFQTANCILNQTYPYYEWLIIDDGSTEKESLEILKQVEAMDPRIKVLHKKNEGLSKTRDYGVKHSSSETDIVVFIDDDDLLDKTYLECSYYTMTANPEAGWCYCDVVNFDGIEGLWSKHFSSEHMKFENLLVSQAMVRKKAFYDVGGFNIDGNGHYEDWIFWLKLMAKGYYPIHMSFYGFWYRRKKSSGQMKLAMSKHKRNMKEIKSYASKINQKVNPIEYPRENYNWDGIRGKIDGLIVPRFSKSNKTNILVIVPWMVLGGADKFNLDLFRLLDKEKFSITLISTQPTEYVWRQNFEQVCDSVFDLSTFIDRRDWISFISYIIESRQINIVFNTNSVTGYMMLPYIYAKYPELPIIDYVHMEEWYNRNGGYLRDSSAVGSVIDRTFLCNRRSEDVLVNHFKRPRDFVKTVYIGVDADKFNPKNYDSASLRNKYHISKNRFVVSLIARIDYQKRPFLLMKIIENVVKQNQIPNILFLIAGDGPLLKDIQKIARKKKLDKYIIFLGKTSKPDEIYAVSDMTINCSIKEGLALTAYESLSMGVPVLSADVGGQRELITDKTGVIVPCLQDETQIFDFKYQEEEIQPYVEGIMKIFKENAKYRKACRERILDGFTIQNMIVNMQSEFKKLTKTKKKPNELLEHIDITKELFNQYLLADKNFYQYWCQEYNSKMYGSSYLEPVGKRQKVAFIWRQWGIKLHMPNEFDIILRIGFEILKQIKYFVKSVITIPYLTIKLLLKLICHEFYRIKNTFIK